MNTDILSKLIITRICSATSLYTPQGKKVKKKDRPCWAIIIKYEGKTVYSSNGKEFTSDINNIVILPKGCSYDWYCAKSGCFCNIEFECESTFPEPIFIPIKNGTKLLKAFKDIEYKRNLKSTTSDLECIRDTYSILIELAQTAREHYLPTAKQQKIAPALEYISEHHNEKITNDTLAAITGLSVVYFRKIFTDLMGVSPIVYIHQLRIEKAKEMLRSDYGSISDIAQSLGYISLYDFSRDFKKHTGISPSKY